MCNTDVVIRYIPSFCHQSHLEVMNLSCRCRGLREILGLLIHLVIIALGESSHTLGGAGEGRVEVRRKRRGCRRYSCQVHYIEYLSQKPPDERGILCLSYGGLSGLHSRSMLVLCETQGMPQLQDVWTRGRSLWRLRGWDSTS